MTDAFERMENACGNQIRHELTCPAYRADEECDTCNDLDRLSEEARDVWEDESEQVRAR